MSYTEVSTQDGLVFIQLPIPAEYSKADALMVAAGVAANVDQLGVDTSTFTPGGSFTYASATPDGYISIHVPTPSYFRWPEALQLVADVEAVATQLGDPAPEVEVTADEEALPADLAGDLIDLTRAELNQMALDQGITNATSFKTKAALIEAMT